MDFLTRRRLFHNDGPAPVCPSDNTIDVDQSSFWDHGSVNWDTHRIGWIIAGSCAIATTLITLLTVFLHARNYRVPAEQRQLIRVLYLPMVYAIFAFVSYRFFRDYTYYNLLQVIYEALALPAFLLLLIQYVADTASDHNVSTALKNKPKQHWLPPFSAKSYRPSNPNFLYNIKGAVLQYAILRPIISVIGIICEAANVLCPNQYNLHFANIYLRIADLVSMLMAVYAMILFFVLVKPELKGRRALAKFLSIKLIIFFNFIQNFVLQILQKHNVIHATQYWTTANIADGINSLATAGEMVLFSLLMLWAFPVKEYKDEILGPRRSFFRAIFDSINFADLFIEGFRSIGYIMGNRKDTHHDQMTGLEVKPHEARSDEALYPAYAPPPGPPPPPAPHHHHHQQPAY